MTLVHATAIDVAGLGCLIMGPSGAGKSDLALRMIEAGALLVSDDQTRVAVVDGRVIASAAPNIKGLIEVRGLGIVRVASKHSTCLRLVVSLGDAVERMPDPAFWEFPGSETQRLRLIHLKAFEASAPAKLRMALHSASNP